jgi:hypothetical protein
MKNPNLEIMQMKNMPTLIGFLSLFCLCLATANQITHPENGGDGTGLRVRLEVSWTIGMFGEKFPYQYILENVSDRPIPMAIPNAKYGLALPWGGQAFLEPDILVHEPMFSVHNAVWPPMSDNLAPPEAWAELKPGERITWNRNRLPTSLFSSHPPSSLQAHWLLNEGHWISSKVINFKMYDVYNQREHVFTAEWSSSGEGKDTRKNEAYIVQILDKSFLYWTKNRVAMVQKDDEFEHQVDEHGTNLEITIKGQGSVQKKYVHLRHGLVGDEPWPIGPVTIFAPKPEPIPPDELAAIRAEMGLNPDGSTPTDGMIKHSESNDSNTNSVSKDVTGEETIQQTIADKRIWPWIALTCILLMIPICFLLWKARAKGSNKC